MTLAQLYHQRKVITEELQQISHDIDLGSVGYERLLLRKQKAEEYSVKFSNLQRDIDDLVLKNGGAESEAMTRESEVRKIFNIEWENLMVIINKRIRATEKRTSEMNKTSAVHSDKINFTCYDQDAETVRDFLNRLDIYFDLIGCQDDKSKSLVLLNSLEPKIHKDLCASILPSDPKTKSFEDLSSVLKKLLDGQKNIFVEQHKFVSRIQKENETIQDFCVALKNLSINCDFVCECGKLIDDSFLKLQFIRGIRDQEIRQKFLQLDNKVTFEDMVKQASAIELSKIESFTMKTTTEKHR